MKKIYFYLFLGVFALQACKESNPRKEVLSFDLEQERVSLSDLDLIADYEIVPLQTTPETKIGKIDKVIKTDDRIYVLDANKAKAVFVFDNDGKSISTINRFGSANDEYLQLSDICVDEENGSLLLLSRMPSKILHFNIDGDSLLKITPTERSFERIEKVNDTFLVCQGNYSQGGDHNNVCRLSEDGKILETGFDILPGWESTFSKELMPFGHSADGSILFMPPFTYDIYCLDNGFSADPSISLDFGDQNLPSELNSFDAQRENNTSGYITEIRRFAETDKHRLFHVIYKGQEVLLVNEKSNNENHCATPEIDHTKYFIKFGKLVSMDNDYIISWVDASDMDLYLTGKNEYNDFTQEYATQIANLNNRVGKVEYDDNPLLIFYSLK